ncbi:MAG: hypothetical protein QG670_2796 [Thermoproteota archaeon]|nr:hypothetical protein [Thermoproteota archaeon]
MAMFNYPFDSISRSRLNYRLIMGFAPLIIRKTDKVRMKIFFYDSSQFQTS